MMPRGTTLTAAPEAGQRAYAAAGQIVGQRSGAGEGLHRRRGTGGGLEGGGTLAQATPRNCWLLRLSPTALMLPRGQATAPPARRRLTTQLAATFPPPAGQPPDLAAAPASCFPRR